MSPIETQAMAEVLFWFIVFIVFVFGVDWLYCRIHDALTLTPEEQTQREGDALARRISEEHERQQRERG